MPKYYNIKPIMAINAEYNILLSERSNGKSYACKRLLIDAALADPGHIKGIFLRRAVQEIAAGTIKDYFLDMCDYLDKKSKGKYNTFSYWQGEFYISHFDENFKIVKDFPFCKACHLFNAQLYKSSLVVPHCEYIIFEEFMNTDSSYLINEPEKLLQFTSTVFRHKVGKVWLLANKVSRVCPYIAEWGLRSLTKIEPGTIDQYNFNREVNGQTVTTKIALEHCPVMEETAKSSMFFGKSADSVANGFWETNEHPHIIGDLADYDIMYSMSLENDGFKFNIHLLMHKTEDFAAVYVYPASIKTYDRLITAAYSSDHLKTPTFRKDIKAEVFMLQLLQRNKWVFPNNLLGDDFFNTIEGMKENPLVLR